MVRSQHPTLIPFHLWSSLAALFVVAVVTIGNVIRDADPDVILWRAIGLSSTVFLTCQAAQMFAKYAVQGKNSSQNKAHR